MALRDPLAVYNAANNLEAHLLRNLLADAGIEAFVTEDVSQIGAWLGGLVPEIHKPQVWIDRADTDRAKPVLDDYERRLAERENTGSVESDSEGSEAAVCLACGETLTAGQSECSACGWSYADEEGESLSGERAEERHVEVGDEVATPNVMGRLRSLKRPLILVLLSPILAMIGLLGISLLVWLVRLILP
jgi:rubredoxin